MTKDIEKKLDSLKELRTFYTTNMLYFQELQKELDKDMQEIVNHIPESDLEKWKKKTLDSK